jgi:hypothetical protein
VRKNKARTSTEYVKSGVMKLLEKTRRKETGKERKTWKYFFLSYLTAVSVSRLYSVGRKDDCRIGNDLEGSGRGLIEILSQHMPGGT